MGRIAATELMPDFAGRMLDNDRYRLLESLGAGAYGKVYRALDTTSPEDAPMYYAIKCLDRHPPGSHTDELQQKEFALHKLVSGHPNIVTFHRWFRDQLFVYVVLDLCTGGDLFSAITDHQTFHRDTRLIKAAFVELIDGLQHCHELGVFHRDIKPENVLCANNGTSVQLADFGLSTKKAVCEDYGCGSSYYMSPECIGKEVTMGRYSTRHTDVWALGVIFTNMITGRNPWRYATSRDECFAAYLDDNDFLRQVLPISEGVNSILKRIFHLNPLCRLSLSELRQEVMALETMYTTDKEPNEASGSAHKKYKASNNRKDTVDQPPPSDQKDIRGTLSRFSIESDEKYLFASPLDDHRSVFDGVVSFAEVVRSTNPDSFSIGPPSSSSSLSPPSSGSGSVSGPITPATHAAEPDVEVPDLSEGDLGEVGPPGFARRLRPSVLKAKKRVSKSTQFFRMAVQRIKGVSSSSGVPS